MLTKITRNWLQIGFLVFLDFSEVCAIGLEITLLAIATVIHITDIFAEITLLASYIWYWYPSYAKILGFYQLGKLASAGWPGVPQLPVYLQVLRCQPPLV